MQFLLAVLLVALVPLSARAGEVFYLDGSVVTETHTLRKGVAEVSLPAAARISSVRITPPPGGKILRVENMALAPSAAVKKEKGRLEEKRGALQDRLKALEAREEIFTAAAKSQSAKAPKKSKNNPEPLESVRRGTEFAIGQLEAVYRLRRTAESELKAVDERLARLKSEGEPRILRVRAAGKGAIGVSYERSDRSWKPSYDFRLEGGSVRVSLYPVLPPNLRSGSAVVSCSLADSSPACRQLPAGTEPPAVREGVYPLVPDAAASPRGVVSFAFSPSDGALPAGEGACYRDGVYAGAALFPGAAAGARAEVRCDH